MPLDKKISVAMNERKEKRLMPHTPWPLVQPLASDVPIPTSNPDKPKSNGGNPVLACGADMN